MQEHTNEIAEIANAFQLDVETYEDCVLLKNRENGSAIEVFKSIYSIDGKKEGPFSEYIVRFATQHRHIKEWEDAEAYIRMLLMDERLPIEFYGSGRFDGGRFGGDIGRDDYFKLSAALLSERFLYSAEELSQFEFEIHSWSSQYDVKRMPVTKLPLRKG